MTEDGLIGDLISSDFINSGLVVTCLCAVLAAVFIGWLVHPLMTQADRTPRRVGYALITLMAAGALGLYMVYGQPDQPGAPALFETEGPRAARRALTGQELAYMQAVAEDPASVTALLALGAVRLQAGRADEALVVLESAAHYHPGRQDVQTALGAAYYAVGLAHLKDHEDTGSALSYLRRAREAAPADAPYRPALERDYGVLSSGR